jgi:hypothetical protein
MRICRFLEKLLINYSSKNKRGESLRQNYFISLGKTTIEIIFILFTFDKTFKILNYEKIIFNYHSIIIY